MSDNIKKRVRLLYGILLAVMMTLSGVLLMIGCVNIYRIGARPFTYDNISAEFSNIAVPIWITVGLIVVGAVLALLLPGEKEKLRAAVDKKTVLDRLSRRIDTEALPAKVKEKLEAEEWLCKALRIEAIEIIASVTVIGLVYVLNFKHFGEDYNASVIAACTLILPLTLFSIGVAIAYMLIESASLERRIALIKSAMTKSSIKATDTTACEKAENKKLAIGIRIAVVAVAVAFIVLGIFNGGMADVLSKAINICTECIGLG